MSLCTISFRYVCLFEMCFYLTSTLLSGGWVPETPRSFHHWQPASRWRLHQWWAKPDNPAMSPYAPKKTSTCYTLAASVKMEIAPMVGKTRQPSHEPPCPQEDKYLLQTKGGEKLLNPGGGGDSYMKQTGMLVVSLN